MSAQFVPAGPMAEPVAVVWFDSPERREAFAERVERVRDHIAAGRYEDRAAADLAALVTALAAQSLAVGR